MVNSFVRRHISFWAFSLAVLAGVTTAYAAAPLIAPAVGSKAARSQFDIKSQAIPVALNRAMLAKLKKNDEVDFLLPNGTSPLIIFDRIEDHGGGIRSSVGYLKEHGKEFRVIITTGPGGTFGSIRTPDTIYRIVPGKDGQDLLVDMTEEQKLIPYINLGNDSPRVPDIADSESKNKPLPSAPAKAGANTGESSAPFATPTPQNTIDLMVVYTNGLAGRLGSGLMTRLYNLVTAANTAYADSEVAITVRLINATMVTYTDANGDGTALDDISPSGGVAGAFNNIETIRNSVGADMVALLRNGSDFGGHGIAWLTTSATPQANFMYSVTTGCVVGCDSVFIHELGHNMGNAHDRATAAFQGGGVANPRSGAFPYSFGHFVCASGALTCNPNLPSASGGCNTQPLCTTSSANNIGTIMSYFNPVTLKFSNPNLLCQRPGQPGGAMSPCGVANEADNARSMNNMRLAIQNLKATVISGTPPGAIQLSTSNFSGAEATQLVNVAVSRVGGSSGSVSVSYATADGSAKARFDYAAASGTLTWANGDTADKIIPITLINDGVTEGGESFTVNISNPTGATGIFLGSPTTASVQITEIDNVVLPASVVSSSTTLSPSANPSFAGQSVTFTATVTGASGTPAGVVTFRDGGNIIAGCNLVVMTAGSATCATSALTQGAHSITADYSGNTTYDVSTSSVLNQTVNAGIFLLTVAKAGSGNGEVTSAPAGINTGLGDNSESYNAGAPVTLTATPQGGSTFAGWSGGGCSGTSTCMVTMNAITNVTATFNVVVIAPGAPTIGTATPGNTNALIAFTAPASNGGSAILDYTVTCGGGSSPALGTASPITVIGLNNGMLYTCSVTARNSAGNSAASGTVNVTPSAGAALALLSVKSRKAHGQLGSFDVPITAGIALPGLVSVEPRSSTSHSIVFELNNTVNVMTPGTATVVDGGGPIGSAGAVANTNNLREVIVTLTGIPDNKRVTVSLTGVNGSFNTSASLGFLVGDVSSNRTVNASDISAVKARQNLTVNDMNARFDIDVNGAINQADITAAKARSGRVIP